jgi:hypothetical protein
MLFIIPQRYDFTGLSENLALAVATAQTRKDSILFEQRVFPANNILHRMRSAPDEVKPLFYCAHQSRLPKKSNLERRFARSLERRPYSGTRPLCGYSTLLQAASV